MVHLIKVQQAESRNGMQPVAHGQQSFTELPNSVRTCLVNQVQHRIQHFILPLTTAREGMEDHLVGSSQGVIKVVSKLGGFIVAARVVVDDSTQQALAQVPLQILLLRLLPCHINASLLLSLSTKALDEDEGCIPTTRKR